MKKANFSDSDKFYVTHYINGNESKNKVNINFLNNKDAVINDKIKGSYTVLSSNSNKFVCYEIANLFDIDIVSSFIILNNEGERAIFTKEGLEEDELLIGVDFVFKKVFDKYNNNDLGVNNWIANTLNIPKDVVLEDENNIKILIEAGINSIRDSFVMDEVTFNKYKFSYINMIFFDYIINNSVRNPKDYKVIINNITKDLVMAPIDCNFRIRDNDNYTLNNRVVNRSVFIKVLFKYYYSDIRMLSRTLTDHYITYIESINAICMYNLDKETSLKFVDMIRSNLKSIEALENDYSDTEEKVNKIEHTQVSIRINQEVMKKNLLMLGKYPLKKLKEEIEADEEEVKVILEEKNKFVVFIVIGIILLSILIVSYFIFM